MIGGAFRVAFAEDTAAAGETCRAKTSLASFIKEGKRSRSYSVQCSRKGHSTDSTMCIGRSSMLVR